MSEQSEEVFDYQGYLIFNGIYATDLAEDSDYQGSLNEVEITLLDDLGRYEKLKTGSSEGVEKLPLRDYFRDDEYISSEIQSLADSLIAFRFLYEDRLETEGYPRGSEKLQTVEIPTIKDADIYWDYPHYLYFRGAEGDVKKAVEYTSKIFDSGHIQSSPNEDSNDSEDSTNPFQDDRDYYTDGSGAFRQLIYEGDFLLWIFYRYCNQGIIDSGSNLEIDRLTDASMRGDPDVWGGDNKVGDTSELAESPPLLSGILQNKSLKMIEGSFAISNKTIRAEIQTNKVHVKASVGDIKRVNKTKRVALTIKFLHELSNLYQYWDDLNPSNKYPSYDFFRTLYRVCKSQGMTLDHISSELRREYCNKRGERLSDWDL